ncbi:MAG: hypothetical protein A3K09_00210 [Nitrospinae bacterium RIFCSPLOWO2_12_FULL_47_7]|nr:MAG: hypothetical protein A3K09_00210 [Nitrospinae bacterium RIFCSPLOWO2_12_FULL_47_7]
MRIVIIVEGETEMAFKPHLQIFLKTRLEKKMPKLVFHACNGRIPTDLKLRRVVENYLLATKDPVDAVIALTDVYTGTREFIDAQDAKQKMRQWVGKNPKFYPHVALHDFEAWLLPYWNEIQSLAGHNQKAPGSPEGVNHDKPPSYRIKEVFRIGSKGRGYIKTRDANRILAGKDLTVAAKACPEMKAFLNTILKLSGGETL